MQARAVELLCKCDDVPDDNIELGVLKGLLTAVTSATLHVHGQVGGCASAGCVSVTDLFGLVYTVNAGTGQHL